MPTKSVHENTCERCTRTWYTEQPPEPVSVSVRMALPDGPLHASFGLLCSSCVPVVKRLVQSIMRSKPEAKEEEAVAPPSRETVAPPSNGLSEAVPRAVTIRAAAPPPNPHRAKTP
jgi:hypothetical protein